VALSHVLPLFLMLPYFPILMLSSLYLYLYLYIEIKNAMDSVLHFFYIYYSDIHLCKKNLPSSFEKLLWSNNFIKVSLSMKIKMAFSSYKTLGFKSELCNLPIFTLWQFIGLST
jgi:hypothetical protein